MAVESLFVGLAAGALGLLYNWASSGRHRTAGRAPVPDELKLIRALLPAWPDVPVRIVTTSDFDAKVGSGVFGRRRSLLIAESILEPAERDSLTTVLAHESGHLSARLLPPDLAPIYLASCYSAAVEAGRVRIELGVAVFVISMLLAWAAGKAHWRHEEFAADRRSPAAPEPLCSYYRRMCDSMEDEPEASRLPRLLRYPTFNERIARLSSAAAQGGEPQPDTPGGRSAMGKYRHLAGSSEDFARRKQEEIDLEDRGWSPPKAGSGGAR